MTKTLAILLAACAAGSSTESPRARTVPSGCTVFTICKGEQVLFGGNDDYIHPDSYYWIDPGDGHNYGAIWIGQPDNVQQGVNERGLAYDATGLPRVNVNPHAERLAVSGGYSSYPIHILHECATVEEVIAWIRAHQWHSYMHDQLHFADATGDAVVISAGTDGELVFTRKPRGDGFLVCTNFNVAHPANGYGYPCPRYARAQELLGPLVNQAEQVTVQDATSVLDAVHQKGGTSWTIESLVADLPRGLVYLYYFHQFDRPVLLNVKEEIAGRRAPGPLSKLFPDDVRQEAARRYQRIQARARYCRWVGTAWSAAALGSLTLLLSLGTGGRRALWFWAPAAILLGPGTLLVRLAVGRGRYPGTWRIALLEATGDVMPTVLAFVATLIIIILVPAIQGTWFLQVALEFGLPLVVGWLVFHGPLLAPVAGGSYGRFLGQRLPQVLVAANLGMGGVIAAGLPLVSLSLRVCPVLPLTVGTVMVWWMIAVLGAWVGSSLLFLYEYWAVRHGFQAWSILAGRSAEVRTPSWRKLWWWIPLSGAGLLSGLAAGVVLLQLALAL